MLLLGSQHPLAAVKRSRFQTDVMVLTVAILIVLVQIIQFAGNAVARRLDKR